MPVITAPIIVKGHENDYPLSRAEAAQYLGISAQTLANYVGRGTGPVCYRIGTNANSPIVYFEDDLIRWSEEAEEHRDNRTGRGRAAAYGYVNPVGVNTRDMG